MPRMGRLWRELGDYTGGLQQHDKERTRHHAPESCNDRCHHHEFEAPVFKLTATHGVAHDDERRREHQKWYSRNRLCSRLMREKAKSCRTLDKGLIPARQSTRECKA